MTPVSVLAFSGSLRKASYNSGLIRAATTVLPEGMTLEVFDLSDIPLYNGDVETAGTPESVRVFKDRIAAADALLISTPEYNNSIPGVLKNALDWASRPNKESPFIGKPAAIMGAGGVMGTIRAQMALRQVAASLNLALLNKPEVMVARAWEKFDSEGNLHDEPTFQQIAELLKALGTWTRRLHRPESYNAMPADVKPTAALN